MALADEPINAPASPGLDSDQTVTAMVRTLMQIRRIPLGQVAATLRLSKPSVSDRMTGKTPWRANEVWLLAQLFGVEVGRLFEEPESLIRRGTDGADQLGLFATDGSEMFDFERRPDHGMRSVS